MGALRSVRDISDRRGRRKASRATSSLLVPARKAWLLVSCQSHWGHWLCGLLLHPLRTVNFLIYTMRRMNRTLQGCGAIVLAKMFVQVLL